MLLFFATVQWDRDSGPEFLDILELDAEKLSDLRRILEARPAKPKLVAIEERLVEPGQLARANLRVSRLTLPLDGGRADASAPAAADA